MALWRVDIGDVSHRYVDAETKTEALSLVIAPLIAGLDLRASPATRTLASMYDQAGPNKRKQIIASMDGLTNPRARQQARAARRRLARLIKYDLKLREWLRQEYAKAPPIPPPDNLDAVVRAAEIRHIEQNFHRLREWERHSPIHDQ
jgi:hypothetical protein